SATETLDVERSTLNLPRSPADFRPLTSDFLAPCLRLLLRHNLLNRDLQLLPINRLRDVPGESRRHAVLNIVFHPVTAERDTGNVKVAGQVSHQLVPGAIR